MCKMIGTGPRNNSYFRSSILIDLLYLGSIFVFNLNILEAWYVIFYRAQPNGDSLLRNHHY